MGSRGGVRSGMMFDDTPRGLLEFLLIAGGMALALTAAPTLIAVLAGIGYTIRANDRNKRERIWKSFDYLKRHKYISWKHHTGGNKRIILTSLGRSRGEKYRLQRLIRTPVRRPFRWDGRWRLILFDIPAEKRTVRNAFRHLIRQMGAVMIQKSVWMFPFDCTDRIELLRRYFNLSDSVLRVALSEHIGDDHVFRSHFKLH